MGPIRDMMGQTYEPNDGSTIKNIQEYNKPSDMFITGWST